MPSQGHSESKEGSMNVRVYSAVVDSHQDASTAVVLCADYRSDAYKGA